MRIVLMRNNSERNKVDKEIDTLLTLEGTLRDNCSIINPVFTIQLTQDNTIFSTCNYCYIEEFKRYYFVSDVVVMTDKLFKVNCHVDVLTSFAPQIRKCKCIAQRQQTRYNLYLNDGNTKIYQMPRIQKKAFPNKFHVKEFVLVTAGKQADL